MKLVTATLLMPILGTVLVATTDDLPKRSGLWEVNWRMVFAQFGSSEQSAMNNAGKPEQVCITPSAAARGPGLATSDPSQCTASNARLGGGTFSYDLVCNRESGTGTTKTTVSGVYTPDTYSGSATSIQMNGTEPIEMRSDISGRRLEDCSASAS